MLSAATSVRETASRPSISLRRWTSRSSFRTLKGIAERSSKSRSVCSTSTVATHCTSSFLPELNSTPPMPTFQKPMTPNRNGASLHHTTPTPMHRAGCVENLMPSYLQPPEKDADDIPIIKDPGNLLSIEPSYSTEPVQLPTDCIYETPPLPSNWTKQHDKAICLLDVRNYSLPAIVAKLRRTFPGLRGTLTPTMIDKRLRQLDQDINIDYYRAGLRSKDEKVTMKPPCAGVTCKDSNAVLDGSQEGEEASTDNMLQLPHVTVR